MYEQISISDIADVVTGKTPSTKDSGLWEPDIPFITPKDLQATKHIVATDRGVSNAVKDKYSKQVIPAGSICVSCIGNLGYVGVTEATSLTNQQINTILPNDPCDSDYLYYAMRWLWPYFKHLEGQSTALSIINKSQFKRISIPWPNQRLRQRISDILNRLDDMIELNLRTNDYLAETCFVKLQAMTHETDASATVDDYCERIYSGGTPSTNHPEYWNGDLPWLSSGETRNLFIIGTEKTITREGVQDSSTKLAFAGDVVMASAGQGLTRGQTSMILLDTYVNQSVIIMHPKSNCGAFLLFQLAGSYDKLRAWSDSTSTRGSMSGKLLRGFEMPALQVDKLEEYESFCAPLIRLIKNNLRECDSLAKARDVLLPRLMSGEIDVSNVKLPTPPNNHLSLMAIEVPDLSDLSSFEISSIL